MARTSSDFSPANAGQKLGEDAFRWDAYIQNLSVSDGFNLASGYPASSTDTGAAGDIKCDGNYIYVCYATNAWKRVALSAF